MATKKKPAAKKATKKKATAKKAPAKKKAAAKKAAPKKATAKKATKKKATAKKATKKAAPKKATAKKAPAKKKAATKRKPNAAFMAPMQPSAALGEVIGSKPMPRTDVTKKIWDYIKKNGLQDKANRRNINADEKLMKIFGKKQVSMFEMTKLVSKHLSAAK